MNNHLQIFENDEFGKIRVVKKEGKVNFVATDIAKSLGYSNARDAVNRHCRWVAKHDIPHPQSDNKTIQVNVVPEGDLYRLIAKSELPKAKEFESWIFDEVLPSIRKTGMYATDETIDKILADPDFGIKLLSQLKEERKEKQKLVGKINDLKPKADYTDTILKNKGLVTITQIAKDYGMSGRAMNELLHDLGVQYKQSGQWLLYAEHQGEGYTHSETIDITRSDGTPDVVMNTKWTQKGRLFLYNLLKDNGILPVIEREEINS